MSKVLTIYTGITILLACLVTIFSGLRFYARWYRRWGWDDALLGVGCIWMIGHTSTAMELSWRWGHVDSTQLALFWIGYISFLSMIWSARLSILLCICRITPAQRDRRQREKICVGFGLLYLLEIAVVCWSCAANAEFNPEDPIPKCFNKIQVPIYHLISSTVADSILLVLPLLTLRALKRSAPRMQALFSLAFSASACTTVLSISASVIVLCTASSACEVLALIEGYVSLIVCSLPVLVGFVCRVLGLRESSEPDQKTLPPIQFSPPPNNLSETNSVSTCDSFRSASWNEFWSAVGSFLAAGSFSTSRPPLEPIYESSRETSLIAHVKSVHVVEECGEEGKEAPRELCLDDRPPEIPTDLEESGKATEGSLHSTHV